MMRRLLSRFALMVAVFGMSQAVITGNGSMGEPSKADSPERARQLWEMALTAKGGRERLNAVQSIAITQTFGQKGPSTELCVFPDRYWNWEDHRPGKLGLSTQVKNFELNVDYWVLGHLPNDPHKSQLKPEERSYFREPQLIYLLETRWFKPELLRAYKDKLGSKDVDVVEAKVDQFRMGVFLDAKTHLPVRIAYFSNYTGDRVFRWFGLSDYVEVKGILVPHSIILDGGRSIPVQVEINVEFDPAVFERPPSIAQGPNQWRAKGSKISSNVAQGPAPNRVFTTEQIQTAINQLQEKDENVYIEARDLLLSAGRTAIPALTEETKRRRGEAKFRLASTALSIDEESEAAVTAFRGLLLDKNEEGLLRRHSAFKLAASTKGIAVLIGLLKDRDVFVRRSVVFAFDEITEQSEIPDLVRTAVPLLKELLKDPDKIVRGMAEEVLDQIRPVK